MWEMIDRMFGDTLWIWTALVGSILGAMSVKWLRDTRIGLWAYGKFDWTLDYLRDRWGWTFLNQDADAWKKVNPNIARQIEKLDLRLKNIENHIMELNDDKSRKNRSNR